MPHVREVARDVGLVGGGRRGSLVGHCGMIRGLIAACIRSHGLHPLQPLRSRCRHRPRARRAAGALAAFRRAARRACRRISSSSTASACRPASSAARGSTGCSPAICRPMRIRISARFRGGRVSAHALIRRDGEIVQYVPFSSARLARGPLRVSRARGVQRFLHRHRARRHRRAALRRRAVREPRCAHRALLAGLSVTEPRAHRRPQRHRARAQDRSRRLRSTGPRFAREPLGFSCRGRGARALRRRARAARCTRASTNSRSDRRLRYCVTSGATGSRSRASVHTRRSARRAMARARWHAAAPGPAAGQDEFLQRRQRIVERIERLLEPRDVLGLDHAMARNAQLAAKIEQLVLHFGEAGDHASGRPGTASSTPTRAVQLVRRAIGLDARVVLANARAIAEAGRAVVARCACRSC